MSLVSAGRKEDRVIFIVIEGIDACGKSTQIELLAKYLKCRNYRFPNDDSPTGRLIRGHLRKEWTTTMEPLECQSCDGDENADRMVTDRHELDALTFQALQFANRLEKAVELSQYVGTSSPPAVADRYLASAIVYGGADCLDVDYLIDTQKWLPQPDLNILIDIPIGLSLERRPERRDRYEENTDFLRDVMGRYLALWARMIGSEGDHWVILNGDRPVDEIHKDIVETVTKHANRAH